MQHKLPRLVVTRLPFLTGRGPGAAKRPGDTLTGRPGIPHAGIHIRACWTPAFAGVTESGLLSFAPAAGRPLRLVYR